MRHRTVAIVVALAGCGANHGTLFDGGSADGSGVVADAPGGNDTSCGQLSAVLRDFRSDHPDFEHATGDDRGLVRADLGADNKPVYAPAGSTSTVSGQASFDQWYRDTPGVNLHFEQQFPLVEGPTGTFTYDDQTFFPLDGMGWPTMDPAQEIYGHNFWFTTEIHSGFVYHGGEKFEFEGDDDVFVFVNNKLALDLGGVHVAETGTIDFDASAAALGLSIGGTYPLAVFHAERHTDQSHFRMTTTIDCLIIE
ncbi:MAG: fibro-slime domain-containing protein [Kofleriaceae bacterium]